MMRGMRDWLEAVRQQKFVGVAELATRAAQILSESGLIQARGTVSELPDERTVRYYLTEGLISPAEEKQGTASVFGYRHLLQLLAVKKLQSEHLPIRTIRELVNSRSERQLERLLGSEQDWKTRAGERGEKNEARRYLETLLTKSASSSPSPPRAQAARQTESDSPKLASQKPAPSKLASPDWSSPSSERDTWGRIEIESGLELHVRDGFRMPQEARAVRRLAQAILDAIKLYGGRPGKRGG
jgi:DNA-binding transcriptional MerR regulator